MPSARCCCVPERRAIDERHDDRNLHVYPVKSCRGIALERAQLAATGFADDRHWMLVRPNGRFVTQRELPRMALVGTQR